MDAKLIKVDNGWVLMVNNIMYATDENAPYARLSVKNCQEIENGYDLDELAKEKYPYEKTEMFSCFELDCKQEGFIEGAKTILEILGDKKFTEEDMLKSFSIGVFTEKEKGNHTFEYEEYIQSLQQTEWDVIIKTTCDGMVTGLCCSEVCDCNIIPKLDADGCLILKT